MIRSRELLAQVQYFFTEAFQGKRPCLNRFGVGGERPKQGVSWADWVRRTLSGVGEANSRGSEKKDFHSFRHTVAGYLKQKGIDENLVGGLLGHQTGGITFCCYGKDFKPDVLVPVVELVGFDDLGF